MPNTLTVTRHNGRSGSHGAYNPKHNDRDFNTDHSDHINSENVSNNVYWDTINGYRNGADTTVTDDRNETKYSFEDVERIYYLKQYGDYVMAQNERNEKAGHSERNRTVDDLRTNKKTCPEESIQQIGNIDGTIDPEIFLQIAEDFMYQFDAMYGEHVHIIDWALHLDEATPHIHERHVFDAPDQYGDLAPRQDKALELLGFDYPNPNEPRSRTNNRKMSFDAQVRDLFLYVCEQHGLSVDRDPKYAGRKYLEKNEYILQKQQQKIADVNAIISDAVDIAYEKACDVITDKVVEMTHEEIEKEIGGSIKFHSDDSRKYTEPVKAKIINALNGLQKKISKHMNNIFTTVRKKMNLKAVSVPIKEEIKREATLPIKERLKLAKQQADSHNLLAVNSVKQFHKNNERE